MKRSLILLSAAVLVLAVAAIAVLQFASRRLESALQQALGPRASIGSVAVGWTGVEVHDLRLRGAGASWPAEDELRAQRVHVRPDLASLWSTGWQVHKIEVESAYLVIHRTRQGKLRVVPALLERPESAGAAAPSARVHIEHIVLRDVQIDLFDASVRQPPHRLQLESLQAKVGPLDWPALDSVADVDLQATLKGPQRNGRLAIEGEFTPATRQAKLKASVHGVDLVALQPYLLKVNEGGVKRGTLDLSLTADVNAQHLHAPGKVTITGLELASGGGLLSTFAGVPRHAVLAAMERDGKLDVSFTLDGRLDDPNFSINDNLATKLAGGLAEALGVSIGGVVEGVGGVIKGLFGR